jgi:hypothetical protein
MLTCCCVLYPGTHRVTHCLPYNAAAVAAVPGRQQLTPLAAAPAQAAVPRHQTWLQRPATNAQACSPTLKALLRVTAQAAGQQQHSLQQQQQRRLQPQQL